MDGWGQGNIESRLVDVGAGGDSSFPAKSAFIDPMGLSIERDS